MSNNFNEEEILDEQAGGEEAEAVRFEDKRRFTDDGERVEVKINDGDKKPAADNEPQKSAEVVLLEKALLDMTQRSSAAENKLQEVQKRFEEERTKLETETAEMRTRMKKALEQQADQSRFSFLGSLLPVLDNLNLAVQAAETDASLDNLVTGVKGTARSFEQALISVGVSPVASVGEKFDPQLHEAVDMVETDEEQIGIITAEYAKGYTYNEKLLRPARVQVGTGKAGSAA